MPSFISVSTSVKMNLSFNRQRYKAIDHRLSPRKNKKKLRLQSTINTWIQTTVDKQRGN